MKNACTTHGVLFARKTKTVGGGILEFRLPHANPKDDSYCYLSSQLDRRPPHVTRTVHVGFIVQNARTSSLLMMAPERDTLFSSEEKC